MSEREIGCLLSGGLDSSLISSIVAILGIGIVALPAGIIAGNYKEILEKQEK